MTKFKKVKRSKSAAIKEENDLQIKLNVPESFIIGSKHLIYHREKFPCFAEIIEIKHEPTLQFYVHFCNYDKRLDEWVSIERFLQKEEADKYLSENLENSEEIATIGISQNEKSKSKNIKSVGNTERTLTRTMRRKFEESHQMGGNRRPFDDPLVEQLELEHEAATKVKNIQKIEIGRYEIDCWYYSPFPDAYATAEKLYICENCLKYMKFPKTLVKHQKECTFDTKRHGKLIYKKNNLAVYELDGEIDKLFCQNLCLIAKLFLDHKTLYYDVSPFYFYLLCEIDEEGTHPVGYFSKEKNSPDDYNLACIMTLPPHQRKGYGRFLIQLSYEISKREGKTGSPEKPLSDLGLVSYRSFWTLELLQKLKASRPASLSINDLVESTAFKREDIIDTLARINLLTIWRGEPALNHTSKAVEEHLKAFVGKKFTICDPKALKWPQK